MGAVMFDDLYLRMGDDFSPSGRVCLKAKHGTRLLGACFDIIGTNDQARLDATVVKTIGDLAVGAAVQRAHPTHADHTNPNPSAHLETPSYSSGPEKSAISFGWRARMPLRRELNG